MEKQLVKRVEFDSNITYEIWNEKGCIDVTFEYKGNKLKNEVKFPKSDLSLICTLVPLVTIALGLSFIYGDWYWNFVWFAIWVSVVYYVINLLLKKFNNWVKALQEIAVIKYLEENKE